MKRLQTTAKTGDIYQINGMQCRIGMVRKVGGKSLIDLHYQISPTSGITQQVSTRVLNELLKTATKLS